MSRRACGERGFSIVAMLASITVMLILMGAAVPSWRYVMKDDREQELFFRGDQIARAIERYQRKNANTYPVSMEVLVKGRYLRKAYRDPMSADGKWRLIHPGEPQIPGGAGRSDTSSPGAFASPTAASPSPGGAFPRPGGPGGRPGEGSMGSGPVGSGSMKPPGFGGPGGTTPGATQGAIVGVASTNKDKSLRLMNGQKHYDEWLFIAGQARQLGRDEGVRPASGGASASPGPGPRPGPVPLP
jgi:type II secretory pathway pseudopilin PulG